MAGNNVVSFPGKGCDVPFEEHLLDQLFEARERFLKNDLSEELQAYIQQLGILFATHSGD
ncbi:MAG: hypothetical protein ACRBBW_16235 [Cellvibrionaceae bacterium]